MLEKQQIIISYFRQGKVEVFRFVDTMSTSILYLESMEETKAADSCFYSIRYQSQLGYPIWLLSYGRVGYCLQSYYGNDNNGGQITAERVYPFPRVLPQTSQRQP
jgi:hypothetical protein